MVRQIDYLRALNRRDWLTWLWAGAGALVMNAALFLLLPHLLQPAAKAAFDQVVPQVTMIRLKHPEPPREEKKVEPPKQHKPKNYPRPSEKPEITKFSIPFEYAPALSGPGTLELPVVKPSFNKVGAPIFDSSDLDRPLMVLSRMPPVYPPGASHRGIEGWVTVRFVVTEQGDVEDVIVVASEPPDIFEQSVINCVRNWRFKPGTVSGKPVKARAETTLRFEMD